VGYLFKFNKSVVDTGVSGGIAASVAGVSVNLLQFAVNVSSSARLAVALLRVELLHAGS